MKREHTEPARRVYVDLRPILSGWTRRTFPTREDAESWARRIGRPELIRSIREEGA